MLKTRTFAELADHCGSLRCGLEEVSSLPEDFRWYTTLKNTVAVHNKERRTFDPVRFTSGQIRQIRVVKTKPFHLP